MPAFASLPISQRKAELEAFGQEAFASVNWGRLDPMIPVDAGAS